MATKKVKRYNGEDESMVDQDAADQEATSMMKRGMAEDDSKALPAGYKVEPEAPAKSAPVMRKPKPNFSNEGRSSKAPAPSTPARKVETTNVPKAIADFFRPKSAAEKDSANRAALRESEKPKPKAQMGFKERYASRNYASGGSVSASRRADGIATKGKTRGKIC